MNILITDGESRAALAITRSLGRTHRVIVGATRARSLASVSRYCADSLVYPDPTREATAFVEAIAREISARAIDMVIPVTDVTALLLAKHAASLPTNCKLPLPPFETLSRAADKAALAETARKLGVPIPTTQILASAAESVDNSLGYPLVIKPSRSRVRTPNGWLSTRVSYADDATDLKQQLTALPAAAYPVLLQEKIQGPGVGIFLCYDRGRCIAAFCHRRLREKPPSGGVSVLRDSIPLDPLAYDAARKLLDHLQWHGVAMVEFKRDDRDGTPKLMEINGRFWGSLQLAIDAGVDFPALLAAVAQGQTIDTVDRYRIGVRLRWTLGDFDSLLLRLFKQRERMHMPASERGRWRAISEFLRAFGGDTRSEILRVDDPKPGLLELWQWIARLG